MKNEISTNGKREKKIKEGIWNILEDIVEGMEKSQGTQMMYREAVRYMHLKNVAQFYFNPQEMKEFVSRYHAPLEKMELGAKLK